MASLNANGKVSVLQIILTVLLLIATSVSSYVARQALSNQDRIIAIENNRFTVADGKLVWHEFGQIRNEINGLRIDVARLPPEIPPIWFVKRIDKIEERLGRMEDYLKGNR